MDALTQLLPAELREALRRRELRLARPVLGPRQGQHRSTAAGVGRDFRDHRPYVPGDDLRHLDWRAAARSDRLVVRRTESEDAIAVALMLDASAGMDYGEGDAHKFRHLAVIATALAELGRRQGDAVAFEVLGGDQAVAASGVDGLRPSASIERISALARAALDTKPRGRADWNGALERVGVALRRRSVVVVGSDFLDVAPDDNHDPDAAQEELFDRLSLLRARGHVVLMLQVLHRDELSFPWSDGRVIRFEDPSDELEPLEAPGRDLRDAYLERIANHLDALERGCERLGVHYLRVATDMPATASVSALLAKVAGAPSALPAHVRAPEVGA